MRARNIKPSLFKNEELADLGPYAVVLFEGLWCMADREGRLEDRPRRIKAEIMPYWDVDVDDLLANLFNAGFITRYEVDENRFIQVVNFGKHQHPHVKESASTIPAPDEPGAILVQAPDKSRLGSHGRNETESSNETEVAANESPKQEASRGEVTAEQKSPPESQKEVSRSSTVLAPDLPGVNPSDSGYLITDTGYRIPEDCATAEPPPSSTELVSLENPYGVFVTLCNAIGADESKLAPSFRSQQLGIAKQLLEDGFNAERVGRCIRFLQSQEWRTSPIDLRMVKNEIGRWELNGEPDKARQPVRNGSKSNDPDYSGIDEWSTTMNELERRNAT